VSAARPVYGVADVAAASARPNVASGVLPLLILVIGLAVATVWFVALPALDKPPRAARSCEVIVLERGSTKCVPKPTRRSLAVQLKAKPTSRAVN
jgi:hypothetical protein